jgi:D-arabinose 1-dehydrogenase-like Zn-dependent alcohol dehydrogenase
VAVHGCGGVGLSAIQIAAALGAQVVAVDIPDDKSSRIAASLCAGERCMYRCVVVGAREGRSTPVPALACFLILRAAASN